MHASIPGFTDVLGSLVFLFLFLFVQYQKQNYIYISEIRTELSIMSCWSNLCVLTLGDFSFLVWRTSRSNKRNGQEGWMKNNTLESGGLYRATSNVLLLSV